MHVLCVCQARADRTRQGLRFLTDTNRQKPSSRIRSINIHNSPVIGIHTVDININIPLHACMQLGEVHPHNHHHHRGATLVQNGDTTLSLPRINAQRTSRLRGKLQPRLTRNKQVIIRLSVCPLPVVRGGVPVRGKKRGKRSSSELHTSHIPLDGCHVS